MTTKAGDSTIAYWAVAKNHSCLEMHPRTKLLEWWAAAVIDRQPTFCGIHECENKARRGTCVIPFNSPLTFIIPTCNAHGSKNGKTYRLNNHARPAPCACQDEMSIEQRRLISSDRHETLLELLIRKLTIK